MIKIKISNLINSIDLNKYEFNFIKIIIYSNIHNKNNEVNINKNINYNYSSIL